MFNVQELIRLNSLHTLGCSSSMRCYRRARALRTPTPALTLCLLPQLGKYQEQPQLLDGHLEGFVVPLATLLRQQAILQQSSNTATVQAICRLLNVLVLVRGHKTVVKFFPHEAADLERVISVLKQVKADAEQPGMQAEESSAWEAQSVLLLWLSILIIIPFDLSTVDSNSAASRCA
jgi:hypothetical protein